MEKEEIVNYLKQSYLFSEVSLKGLNIIAKHLEENVFEKGSIIFNEGESGDKLHIITEGVVKITKYDRQGRTKTLAMLKEKDSFGEMALLTKELRSATVEAVSRVKTLSVTRDNFEYFLSKEPSISLQIIKTLSDRLARADRDIKNLALGDARTRISSVLMDFLRGMEEVKFTHQQIADLAGLTRETTTRTLKIMQKEKVIEIKDRKISIADLEKLKEYST